MFHCHWLLQYKYLYALHLDTAHPLICDLSLVCDDLSVQGGTYRQFTLNVLTSLFTSNNNRYGKESIYSFSCCEYYPSLKLISIIALFVRRYGWVCSSVWHFWHWCALLSQGPWASSNIILHNIFLHQCQNCQTRQVSR